jgi:uncharacterized membrane protein
LTTLARAITNIEFKQLLGVGAGKRAIDVQKGINIDAPVEHVFELWAHYQNFPHVMSNVRDIKNLGDGRSRWIMAGPAGTTVEWDAVSTSYTPREVLAWGIEPDALVQHGGIIRFPSNSDGSTTVNICLTYDPGIGEFGHIVASLFGAAPRSQMD